MKLISQTINEILSMTMEQVKEKGFVSKLENANIPERMVFVHSEISEMYIAHLKGNIKDKDGVMEEMGDIFIRVLHVAGLLNIDYEQYPEHEFESNKGIHKNVAKLHLACSLAYDFYRHQNIDEFKNTIVELTYLIIQVGQDMNIDVFSSAITKINANKDRTRDKENMNEQFVD